MKESLVIMSSYFQVIVVTYFINYYILAETLASVIVFLYDLVPQGHVTCFDSGSQQF